MNVADSGRRIRVLFLVPTLRRAGAETQLVDLANRLDPARFDKTLVAFERNIDQLDRVDRAQIAFYNYVRAHKYDFSMVKRIAELIDRSDIDVIHCTIQISLLVGWLATRLAKRRPKLVVAIHTTVNVNRKFELFDQLLYRWLIGSCERVIFVCWAQAEYWGARYPSVREKSVVIYNGVDLSYFDPDMFRARGVELRRTLSIPEQSPVLACVAGFRPEKGHRFLIEAVAALQERPYLVLAGDGPLRLEVERLARQHGIADRVRFLGEVRDVRPLLAAANISVLASTAVETFSIAMLESMAMEVPMVATDIGGLGEALVSGETGELVPPGDAGELARVLKQILADPGRLKEMGRKCREQVRERFSTDAMARVTENVLGEVVTARSR